MYNQQLPFSPDYPATQPMQYSLDNPPFVPPINGLSPDLMYVLPKVCAMLATEASMRAQNNKTRMFTFNQLSANGWRNNDFANLVQMTLNMITLNMMKRIYNNVEVAAGEIASQALTQFTSLNVHNFPALKSMIPQDQVHSAMQNVQIFNNFQNEFGAMSRGGVQFQPPMQQSAFPVSGYPPQQQVMYGSGMNYGTGYPPPQQPFNQNANFQGNAFNTGGRVFSSGNGNSVGVTENTGSRTYASPKPVAAPAPSLYHKEPVVETTYTVKDWHPSEEQPYRALFDTSLFTATYSAFPSNGKSVVIENIIPSGEKMDRSKHTLTLPTAVSYDKEERLGALADNVLNLVNASSNNVLPEAERHLVKEYIDDTWIMSGFLHDAIFDGRINKYERGSDKDCNVFRAHAVVAKPFLATENYDHVIDKLKTAKEFTQLANMLRNYINRNAESIQTTSSDSVENLDMFLAVINAKLTELINEFLRTSLSVPATIDSFTEDAGALRNYLTNKYGQKYGDAFANFEVSMLNSFMHSIEDDIHSQLYPGSEQIITFLPETYSFTYIDVFNKELDFNIARNESLLIRESMTPWLFKVAKTLFDSESFKENNVLHNLLVTKDDVIYKLHKGYLGADAYLVSLL